MKSTTIRNLGLKTTISFQWQHVALLVATTLVVLSINNPNMRGNIYSVTIVTLMVIAMMRGIPMGQAVWAAALLLMLTKNHLEWGNLFGISFSHAMPIILIMTVVALGAKLMSLGGLSTYLMYAMLSIFRQPLLRRFPQGVIMTIVFCPLVVLMAALLHNITAVAIMAPIIIDVCRLLGLNPRPFLVALIPLSNLGGASTGVGDTPALIISKEWQITPIDYSINMIIPTLISLAGIALITSYLSLNNNVAAQRNIDWERFTLIKRIKKGFGLDALLVGVVSILSFIIVSFFFNRWMMHTTVILLLGQLVWLRSQPGRSRHDAHSENAFSSVLVLGIDAVFAITGMFLLTAIISTSGLAEILIEWSKRWSCIPGIGEAISTITTVFISADGAAALLSPIYHSASSNMIQGMALQRGICPGSTVFLISASAGPLLSSICARNNTPLSFRDYAKYGAMTAVLIYSVNVLFRLFFE